MGGVAKYGDEPRQTRNSSSARNEGVSRETIALQASQTKTHLEKAPLFFFAPDITTHHTTVPPFHPRFIQNPPCPFTHLLQTAPFYV